MTLIHTSNLFQPVPSLCDSQHKLSSRPSRLQITRAHLAPIPSEGRPFPGTTFASRYCLIVALARTSLPFTIGVPGRACHGPEADEVSLVMLLERGRGFRSVLRRIRQEGFLLIPSEGRWTSIADKIQVRDFDLKSPVSGVAMRSGREKGLVACGVVRACGLGRRRATGLPFLLLFVLMLIYRSLYMLLYSGADTL